MTKERLIDLILHTPQKQAVIQGRATGKTYRTAENIADHLIANGVIVSPCKVGDVLFRLDKADVERPIKMGVIDEIRINKYGTAVVIVDAYLPLRRAYPSACIGKIVFLTREDAERALEEVTT